VIGSHSSTHTTSATGATLTQIHNLLVGNAVNVVSSTQLIIGAIYILTADSTVHEVESTSPVTVHAPPIQRDLVVDDADHVTLATSIRVYIPTSDSRRKRNYSGRLLAPTASKNWIDRSRGELVGGS
jgi:hypothetical protein